MEHIHLGVPVYAGIENSKCMISYDGLGFMRSGEDDGGVVCLYLSHDLPKIVGRLGPFVAGAQAGDQAESITRLDTEKQPMFVDTQAHLFGPVIVSSGPPGDTGQCGLINQRVDIGALTSMAMTHQTSALSSLLVFESAHVSVMFCSSSVTG